MHIPPSAEQFGGHAVRSAVSHQRTQSNRVSISGESGALEICETDYLIRQYLCMGTPKMWNSFAAKLCLRSEDESLYPMSRPACRRIVPQLLINARTGEVGFSTQMSGYPTQ